MLSVAGCFMTCVVAETGVGEWGAFYWWVGKEGFVLWGCAGDIQGIEYELLL